MISTVCCDQEQALAAGGVEAWATAVAREGGHAAGEGKAAEVARLRAEMEGREPNANHQASSKL